MRMQIDVLDSIKQQKAPSDRYFYRSDLPRVCVFILPSHHSHNSDFHTPKEGMPSCDNCGVVFEKYFQIRKGGN